MNNSLSIIGACLIVFACPRVACATGNMQLMDTAGINSINREAYINARSDPARTIFNAHRTLRESDLSAYKKGKADACLALGMAYLTMYNAGDSAFYYNSAALDIYHDINDIKGEARACYGLAYVYSFKGKLAESERYGRMSLDRFETAGDTRGILNALSVVIYLVRQRNDYDAALQLSERAIATARSVNDTIPLADALNTLGNIYKDMLLFNEAIESFFEAMNLWEAKNDTAGLAIAYGSVGLMYFYQERYDKALEFSLKKLPLSEYAGNKWEVSKTINTISRIYDARKQYDSSLYYLRKGLKINLEMNYPSGIANVSHNMASTFLMNGMTDSARIYIVKAIDIADRIDDPERHVFYITLSRIARRVNNYPEAIRTARKAYEMASSRKDPINVSSAAAILSDIYSETGRKDLAFDYLKKYTDLRDSINNNDYLKKITRLEIENEYERKREAAEFEQRQALIVHENRIRQQSIYLRGLVVLVALLIIIWAFYIYYARLRVRYTRIDLEQRLLRAQMNPHFIFNSLCAVQELIISRHPDKANIYLAKIASLMRNILENSREEYIPFEKEMETLKLYLDVQQLRFEKKFSYEFTLDESIDPENIAVPPMLAQPCLENSVEHGLIKTRDGGKIELECSMEGDLLRMILNDNGVGRDEALRTQENSNKRSLATILVNSRLEYYRKRLGKKNISYEISDIFCNNRAAGTRVTIRMPVKKIYDNNSRSV